MASTEAAAQPAANIEQNQGQLQTIPAAPMVRNVEVEDRSKVGIMAVAGVVGGAIIAGPVGALVGGGIMAAMASGRAQKKVIAMEVFPYGVQTVTLSRDGVREHEGVSYFAIDITPTTGAPWRVMRRYRDFDGLRKALKSINRLSNRCYFPPKRWHKLEGRELDYRREQLESWLRYQLRVSNGVPGCVRILRPFLENARGVVPGSSSAGPQAALPTAASEQQQQQACAPLLKVVVPEGAVAGQALRVLAPDGRTLEIVVPPEAQPGTELKVMVPAVMPSTAPSNAGAPSSPASSASQPSSNSNPPAGAESRPARQPSGEVLQIQVPEGAVAGQTIGVALPNGKQAQMKVPDGLQSGDEIQVWYDRSNDSVAPLPPADPPAQPQSAPETPSSPQAAEATQATQLLCVQVPPGVSAGDTFLVLCPDGRQIPLVLPKGADVAGEVQVKFNAQAGTLTPVPPA
eukprot:CAMPEP_0178443838 /NCGR_PEP_ID=MMETSP0689_2-20121128/39134_1 /TAXON_ID=160604 /ORGANISM="Amphidinium massartii, Strain CS-259" /LENGTH=458 /DNA_ID=CAMNT_0020067923 /DNA_START=26 /DNA_END=1402 /DNA_ORIENTATION=+